MHGFFPLAVRTTDTHVSALARSAVETFAAAPCAVVGAADLPAGRAALAAYGRLAPHHEQAASPETVFDLASITKPVTALLAARLARAGALELATPLGHLLDEARGTPSEAIPLELLLSHRAGLAAHLPLFAPLVEGRAINRHGALAEAARARRERCEGTVPDAGFEPLYSDLGYLLAGEALARAGGAPLATLVDREVNGPLGTRLRPASMLDPSVDAIAPTEHVVFRGGQIVGVVHDENAWALGGRGVCGHAGLFGTALDLLRLGAATFSVTRGTFDEWLNLREFEPLIRPRPGGTLRAGFDGKSAGGSSAGAHFGPASFGHLGFTGTSLWVDPERGLVGVLLTNRVCPSRRSPAGIRAARPAIYDGIAAWAGV